MERKIQLKSEFQLHSTFKSYIYVTSETGNTPLVIILYRILLLVVLASVLLLLYVMEGPCIV